MLHGEIHSYDFKAPQVEATIHEHDIEGCLIYGSVTINIMANWFMEEVGLKPTKSSSMHLKVVDQICVRLLRQINWIFIIVNRVTIKVDFCVFNISLHNGEYPLILGRPWLWQIKVVKYWEKRKMKIRLAMNKVSIQVIFDASLDLSSCSTLVDF